jgi:hypothetical protein
LVTLLWHPIRLENGSSNHTFSEWKTSVQILRRFSPSLFSSAEAQQCLGYCTLGFARCSDDWPAAFIVFNPFSPIDNWRLMAD